MTIVSLLFGSNLGNRAKQIKRSIQLLVDNKLKLLQISSIYETDAWGVENQPAFYNVAANFSTSFSPEELLKLIKEIENQVGRHSRRKWHEREIDIDIIFYGNEFVQLKHLQIPHPYLVRRNFVLMPLNEIASEKIHPFFQLTVNELLQLSIDDKEVRLLSEQLNLS